MNTIRRFFYNIRYPYKTKGPKGDVRWSIRGNGVIHVDGKTWLTSGCVEKFYEDLEKAMKNPEFREMCKFDKK